MNSPMDTVLSIWVVFDHPRDFPRHVVVREQRIVRGMREPVSAAVGCLYDTVDAAMKDWARRGLYWMPRYADDDPIIVGVWV